MALITNFRILSLAFAAGLMATPAVFAETAPAAQQFAQAEQPAQQAIDPNEEQLDSFVVATVRIMTIQQQAQQQMMQTEEATEQEQIRNQAMQMIVSAVEDEGLSVEEYNGIVQKVESDPELGQTVQQRIQDQAPE